MTCTNTFPTSASAWQRAMTAAATAGTAWICGSPKLTATSFSIWANANAIDNGAVFGSGNYYKLLTANYPTSAYVRGAFQNTSLSSGNFTIKANVPTVAPVSPNPFYLYCRIGLPMADDVYFNSVSATFSSS
jgi:hypothetical protein